MADALKILGQAAPSATTLTDLYTVPSATQAIARTISVCNRGGSATTFRISLAIAGAADANAQYIAYDEPLDANSSKEYGPYELAATDKIRVYAGNGNLSFNANGLEVS